jgi:hypothetical protein
MLAPDVVRNQMIGASQDLQWASLGSVMPYNKRDA